MEPSKSFFKKNFRVFRFIMGLSPFYFWVSVINDLLKAFLPYVPIYGSALIIDKILFRSSFNDIMGVVWLMISITLAIGLLTAFLTETLTAYSDKLVSVINGKMCEKTHSLSYAQLEDNKTLRLLKAADEGANGSGGVFSFMEELGLVLSGFSSLAYSCLLLRGIFVINVLQKDDALGRFLNNPWSALLVFSAVLLALAASLPILSHGNKLSYQAMNDNVEGNRRFSYFYNVCSDYRYGKDIRLFHMQKMLLSLQKSDKFGVNAIWKKYEVAEIRLQMSISVLYALLSFVSYAYLGLKALYGLLSVGSAIAYAGAVALLSQGLGNIISGLAKQALDADYLQNYFIYLGLENKTIYGKEKLDLQSPLEIRFSHLSFTYPNQKEKSLDDVSLCLRPGEKLAIVGANGAGKTTLMKLLCRLYEPDSGMILVNEKPLSSYDEDSLLRLSSIVFQDFKLFSFSIEENVASSDCGNEGKVIFSLKKADIYDRILSFKDGIHTVLYNKNDENGVEISGGEAQKIAIARALYKDAPLVVLDEPTSALDPKSEAEVYTNFGKLVKGKTAIFISHRMSSTQFCDEIAVVDKGKIVEYGNHESLLKNENGLYKRMWEAQAQYYR